ncbi:cupredoxin domain-containing protein [Phytoactinopolyspora endophytica]|uniref:cupredoxin domain-containing protein n=1 Tax=Phytoactinopolyspora endophytica TaxID=1642495 RepID=UPI00101D0107|nr:cupredoxin domain-containing protein [Phytoactinopolyspora endophytica]
MRRRVLIVCAALGAIGLAGCGGDDDSDSADEQANSDQAENGEPDADDADEPDDDADEPDDDADEPDDDADEPDDEIVETINVEAGDLYFEGIPDTLPAGTIEIEFSNVGEMLHDVTIEELGDEMVVSAAGGETDTGTVTLEPGEYAFYCAVPGHREQMEVTVTVE